jgi:hypothetical protein
MITWSSHLIFFNGVIFHIMEMGCFKAKCTSGLTRSADVIMGCGHKWHNYLDIDLLFFGKKKKAMLSVTI